MNEAGELEKLIAGFQKGKEVVKSERAKIDQHKTGGHKMSPVRAKAKMKPQAKAKAKVGRPKVKMPTRTVRAKAKPETPKRGRPKGSTTRKATPTRKVTTRKVTRTTPKPQTRKVQSGGNGGRNLLDRIDYNKTKGWNPREGSAPDRIIKALKRYRGDRDKVFNFLLPSVWDFVGKVKRNGAKRTKAEAESMLSYRIARTEFDFAVQTGQHVKATNRAEYGTAGTGQGIFKRAKKKAASTKPAARRGRPPKAKATPATRKPAARRTVRQKPASRRRAGSRR